METYQWIILVWFIIVFLIHVFRPEWLYVPGADPLSEWLRQRRRKKYGDKYK